MSSQEVGVSKTPKFPIACNINKVVTTKVLRPIKSNRLYYTLLSPLALWHYQYRPLQRGIVGEKPEKVTAILVCEG